MHFLITTSFLLSIISTLSHAHPTHHQSRATTPSIRAYSQMQISNGLGGTALTEAQVKFPGNPASLNDAQVAQINKEAQCTIQSEQAFITAINLAKYAPAKLAALNVGMIKNKVLKIYGTLQALQGIMVRNIANGNEQDIVATMAHMQELEIKLARNHGIDLGNKGKKSADVLFNCV